MHPLARACVRALGPPPPYARYRPGHTERMYTNPRGGVDRTYPCPRPTALQERYAAWLSEDATRRGPPARVDAEGILFTAGSVAGIELLVRTFCEPGIQAIGIQSPVFPIYAHQARANGVAVIDVPLGGADFDRLDTDGIAAAGAALTFVCRPNNPVGSVPAWADVQRLAQRVPGLLVVDEAYAELSDAPSAVSLLDHPNVVVLRTFSKAWGLAGVRAGAVLARPDVLDALRVVADPFAFDAPAQRAVDAALDASARVRSDVADLRRRRDALAVQLGALPGVRVFPSDANFLLVSVGRPFDLPPTDLLLAPSVVPGCLRVSIGTPADDADALAFVTRLVRA